MVGFGHILLNSIRHTESANIDIESLLLFKRAYGFTFVYEVCSNCMSFSLPAIIYVYILIEPE